MGVFYIVDNSHAVTMTIHITTYTVLNLTQKQFSIETIVCGVCKTFGCVLRGFQLTHGTVCTKEVVYYRSNIDILVTVSLRIKLFTLIVMLIIGWNSIV